MSDVFSNLKTYRPLRVRRTKTLCLWLDELNRYEWPKAIADATGRENPSFEENSFRNQVMDEILKELGHRVWLSARRN